jgi:hypothetical protein
MYCVESPESYFEDFGEARLKNGVANVRLDREYAAFVKNDHYSVFLTRKGIAKDSA